MCLCVYAKHDVFRVQMVPSTKFVGSIEFEIWTIVWRKLNDVVMTSSHIEFLWNFNTNRPRVYLCIHSAGILFTRSAGHTDTQTHRHTQTNWSENITPPRFCGGVKKTNPLQGVITMFRSFSFFQSLHWGPNLHMNGSYHEESMTILAHLIFHSYPSLFLSALFGLHSTCVYSMIDQTMM